MIEEQKLKNRERAKLWYVNNKEAAKVRIKQWSLELKQIKNRSSLREYNRLRYIENKEEVLERVRLYKLENPEKVKECDRKYREKCPESGRAAKANYKRSRKQATPLWLTRDHFKEIKAFHKLALELTKSTGIQHHVDHIVPLQGKNVCGLNVPWNLRVITQTENRQKSNKLLENI